MRFIFALTLSLVLFSCADNSKAFQDFDQNAERKAITEVMNLQEKAWSDGDVDAFMEGYWNSEKLRFTGSRGTTYGWKETKANYKKAYPTPEIMGKLSFEINEVDFIDANNAILLGKYSLERADDNPSGMFTLTWRKIDGQWFITSDMTCG